MAQWVRALTPLPEDSGSIPPTHTVVSILSKLRAAVTWQQPDRSDPLYKGLLVPSSLSCSSLVLLFFLCFFSPFSPHSLPLSLHVLMASLYSSTSLSFSAFLCLYYPLNSLPHALNKLYSILYHCVAGPSGGKDASAWACRGTPCPHTSPHLQEHNPSLFFYKHNNN